MNRDDLLSYAISFVSFSFRRPGISGNIVNRIILFGSVARGDFSDESDIDIFVDVRKEDEDNVGKLFKNSLTSFMQSREHEPWKLRGVKNAISVNVGVLEEWELKESVLSDGVILYGSPFQISMEKKCMVVFSPIKEVARRNRVIRTLFGNGHSEGIVGQLGGEKLTSRSFIVPGVSSERALSVLSKENADFAVREVWIKI